MNRDERAAYYDRQAERGEYAARIIVLLWIFMSGAAAGWILHRVVG
jgi:hypothetical protein